MSDRLREQVAIITYRVLKAVGRQVIVQGHGSIVLCGTADAMIGIDGFDSYVAAKGGVFSLVEAMGEYRPADQ